MIYKVENVEKKVTELVDQYDAKFKRKKTQFENFTLEDEKRRTTLNRPRVISKFQFPEDINTAMCDVTEHGITCSDQVETVVAGRGFRLAL